MGDDYNTDLADVALKKGASLFIPKPLLPSDIARLWHQILWITGRIPGFTSTKQKKRTLINSDDVNGKRRNGRNAQGLVSSTGNSDEHNDQYQIKINTKKFYVYHKQNLVKKKLQT